MLSVIVPIYNEEKYIAKCLDSILEQNYPKEDMELLLCDGMSNDRTREIITEYQNKYPWINVLDNPKRITPSAMNIGIEAAKGDIIMRLDAHASYENNYFSALVKALGIYEADNVGAVCRTDVLNKNVKTLAIREVLCNKFGVGNSTFRTGIKRAQEVETVPFGCWRKDVFTKYGMYDMRLVRNQDIELNKRIIRGGGKIVIIPDTYCTYLARETYYALAKNNYSNGMWNILTVYFTKEMRSLSLRHFVPLMFILSLIIPIVVGLFWTPAFCISILALCIYLLSLGTVCAKLAVNKGLNFFYLFASFIVLHVSYGWGSLIGILSLPFTKK